MAPVLIITFNLEPIVHIVSPDPQGRILAQGWRSVVSASGQGTGPKFEFPEGIAVEADGTLIVVDKELRAVFRVDPITGRRAILSSAVLGGTLTGVSRAFVTCRNSGVRNEIGFGVSGVVEWNCADQGFVDYRSGNLITQATLGVADASTVGGAVTGMQIENVTCRNATTQDPPVTTYPIGLS